jgi:hypothetical protein
MQMAETNKKRFVCYFQGQHDVFMLYYSVHIGLLGCLEPTSELYERYTAAQTVPKLAKARHIHIYSGFNLKMRDGRFKTRPR